MVTDEYDIASKIAVRLRALLGGALDVTAFPAEHGSSNSPACSYYRECSIADRLLVTEVRLSWSISFTIAQVLAGAVSIYQIEGKALSEVDGLISMLVISQLVDYSPEFAALTAPVTFRLEVPGASGYMGIHPPRHTDRML